MTLRTHLDGAVFAEHVSGRPPAILALHGWGRDRHDVLPALQGREVIAVDLPGFGAAPPPPSPWGAREYAESIASLVVEIGGGPYVVVGHSFGGRVGVCLAADNSDLVAGLVLAGVPLLGRSTGRGRPPLRYRVVRAARRMGLVSEARLDAARRRYGSADYNAASGVMRGVLVRVVDEDYRDDLRRVECPVAFCWGENDTAAPPAVAREAAGIASRVALVDIVEGAGHDVHRDAPERLGAAVDAVVGASA